MESDFVDVIQLLKLDLATRQTNDMSGSKLGGNPAQFYYLISHDLDYKYSKNNEIKIEQQGNKAVFYLPTDDNASVKLVDMRDAMNKFWETCSDKNSFTQEQLTNISFLQDQKPPSAEVQLLINGLKNAKLLSSALDKVKAVFDQVDSFLDQEQRDVEVEFLTDVNLPTNYFNKLNDKKNNYYDLISKCDKTVSEEDFENAKLVSELSYKESVRVMFHNSIWGEKHQAIDNRKSLIKDNLYSPEIINLIKKIDALPIHLGLFVTRTILTLDRIVHHDLDEDKRELKSLKLINSLFEEK